MSRRKTTSRSNSKIEFEKAPILITVVPQCSNKSSILKKLSPDGIEEISVDDVPQSYEKVPIGVALSQLGYPNSPFFTSEISAASEEYADRNTYGLSVFSRIAALKDTEQGLLLPLFTGSVSLNEIESLLAASVAEGDRESFMKAVKGALASKSIMCSSTVDLVIPQAITYAVQTAKSTLRDAARASENVLAWSNTNSSAEHYTDALAIALQTKRAVRFIRWGMEVPAVTFEQLLEENINCFLATGRYIIVSAVRESLDRVSALLLGQADPSHEKLAYIAGYSMDPNGLLKKISINTTEFTPPPSPFPSGSGGKWNAWFTSSILGAEECAEEDSEEKGKEADVVESPFIVEVPTAHVAPVQASAPAPVPAPVLAAVAVPEVIVDIPLAAAAVPVPELVEVEEAIVATPTPEPTLSSPPAVIVESAPVATPASTAPAAAPTISVEEVAVTAAVSTIETPAVAAPTPIIVPATTAAVAVALESENESEKITLKEITTPLIPAEVFRTSSDHTILEAAIEGTEEEEVLSPLLQDNDKAEEKEERKEGEGVGEEKKMSSTDIKTQKSDLKLDTTPVVELTADAISPKFAPIVPSDTPNSIDSKNAKRHCCFSFFGFSL